MAKKVTANRDVVLGMLKKMGASFTSDISTERATKKLIRYVQKNGLPTDYNADEVEVMVALNLAEVDPEETKAPKKEKEPKEPKAKKEKAPKAKKEKKPSVHRVDFICKILSSIPASGLSVEDAAARANKAFGDAGGKANEAQTFHQTRVLLPAALAFGIIKLENDKVFPAKG